MSQDRIYFVLNGFINGDADALAIPAGGGDDPPQEDGWYFFAEEGDADGEGPFETRSEAEKAARTHDERRAEVNSIEQFIADLEKEKTVMKILDHATYVYPSEGMFRPVVLIALLTEGTIKDKAVYVGIVPDRSDDLFAERRFEDQLNWVAANGAKQTYHEALHFFPDLKAEEYRA